MSYQLVTEITILVLAAFVGFEVISKVPTLLHTPLMSGTNAIHGIVIVGAIVVMGTPHPGLFMRLVSFVAVILATANVVGGFVVTDRMLEMFKKRESPGTRLREPNHREPAVPGHDRRRSSSRCASSPRRGTRASVSRSALPAWPGRFSSRSA